MTDGNLRLHHCHGEGIFTVHRVSLARQLFPKSCIPDTPVHMVPSMLKVSMTSKIARSTSVKTAAFHARGVWLTESPSSAKIGKVRIAQSAKILRLENTALYGR